jgi:hypothetical protein
LEASGSEVNKQADLEVEGLKVVQALREVHIIGYAYFFQLDKDFFRDKKIDPATTNFHALVEDRHLSFPHERNILFIEFYRQGSLINDFLESIT